MAMWVVLRDTDREEVTLVYHNLQSDQQYKLGTISAAFDDLAVIEWIFEHAHNLTPGDFIKLSDGHIFQWRITEGARA